jgi:CheY-like chemotaxis protein
VEGDEPVRTMVRSLLTSRDHLVIEARTDVEAVGLACGKVHKVDLLISDGLFTSGSELDLLGRLRAEFPAIKMLFLTGYVDNEFIQAALNSPGATVLEKPFQPTALLSKVQEVLGVPPASA